MFRCPKRHSSREFRIGIHDSAAAFRLKLEGPLGAAGVPEVEACWRTAASTMAGREFIVDLSDAAPADTAGEELVARLRAGGARFLTAEPPRRRDRLHGLRNFPALLACLFARLAAGTW